MDLWYYYHVGQTYHLETKMKKITSKKIRYTATHIKGLGKIAIALSGKIDWLHIEKISKASAIRMNRLIHSGNYDVSTMISETSGVVIFIRTK